MEQIKKAIERAKAGRPEPQAAQNTSYRRIEPEKPARAVDGLRQYRLDRAHLEANRIVAHQGNNPMTIGFDMLRTKVLQQMHEHNMRSLLITSPTAACGKTVSSINLAISIARQPESSAILADFDFRKPAVSMDLGVKPDLTVHDVLTGAADVNQVLFTTDVAGPGMAVLPAGRTIANPAEALASNAMRSLVTGLRQGSGSSIIVFDMPPMLVSDDVMAFLPQVDAVLLVVAAGQSKAQDIESCHRNLPESKFLGFVLTKSNENTGQYYYYG